MAATVRVGTCSWADRGLVETWYPSSVTSAESRLRYYAEHFDTVEVNSSYYAIPEPRTAQHWAERTPPEFVFHVKAFGMMTGHRVQPEQLPPDLRTHVDRVTDRGNVVPSDRLLERVFDRFTAAVAPLAEAGKLGGILMQYSPSVAPSDESRAFIERGAELLAHHEVLVEFRQRGWLEEQNREATLEWLGRHGLTYVVADAPDVGTPNVAGTVIATTTPTAYLRFHGRNAATWNVHGGEASERFDHFYTEEELRGWVEPLRELAGSSRNVYGMFNTNNADQGPVNADLLRRLLGDAGVPVAPPPGPSQPALF
jgi:uncharacterized protein YecE (DUF72 family)